MAGLEVMASLAPKSSSIFTVRDKVPWQIVCIALAKISKEASMYGRLKYAMEDSYRKKVRQIILKHSISLDWRSTQRWKPDNKFFVSLAELVLKESLEPMCCPKCSGRGNVFIDESLYTCTLCLGIGIKSMSDHVRANYIGIKRDTFRRNVRYNYFNEIMPLIRTWEDELVQTFKRM